MIGLRQMYALYTKDSTEQIKDLRAKLQSAKMIKKSALKELQEKKELIENSTNTTVNQIIKRVKSRIENEEGNNNYLTLIKFSCELEAQNELIRLIKKYNESESDCNSLPIRIQKIKAFMIPYNIYSMVINECNKEFADLILREGYKDFTFGNNTGPIRIRKKERHVANDNYNNQVIDWGASDRLRESIIQKKDPELYNLYKSGQIKVDEFKRRSYKHCYNKKLNPTGIKWFIYFSDDYSLWWWWRKADSTSPNTYLYSFKPTEGMNIKDESGKQVLFSDVKKQVENGEIEQYQIKDLPIGTLHKLQLYKYVSSTQHLKYENDI